MGDQRSSIVLALSVLVVGLLVAGSAAAWAVPDSEAAMSPPSGASVRHYDLGDGRYAAVLPAVAWPADTYNQTSCIDTYVFSHDSDASYCNDIEFRVGHVDTKVGNAIHRAFLGFHLSSIPSDAVVTSARVYAYANKGWGRGSGAIIWARRVTSSWGCPLIWKYRPPSVSVNWTSVGSSSGWYYWIITNMVESYWIGSDFGSGDNHGLELRGPESGEDYGRSFCTRNYAGSTYDPYLVVEYELVTPTPTPSATPSRTPTPTGTPTPTPTPTVSRVCEDLVVNSTDDVDDLACDAAHCSLREAIICANGDPVLDHITFDVPDTDPNFNGTWWVISPDSALPALTDNGIFVDGPSQATNQGDTNPDGPEIVITGVDAGAAHGLWIRAAYCVIRGLDIVNFELNGIGISGGSGVYLNTVEHNYIGIDATGTAASPNGQSGVSIWDGANTNWIGPGNVLSGNGIGGPIGIGVNIFDSFNNTVKGNYIGTDASGEAALPNTRNGMEVSQSEGTVIKENVISGNTYAGVKMFVVEGAEVRDNVIGLNAAGTLPVPNEGEGLIIEDEATDVTVGPDNVISGNGGNGIGLKDPGVHDLTVFGNTIGADATGALPIPNGGNGIQVFDHVHDVTIGPDNTIAHNAEHGVYLYDEAYDNTIGPDNVIAHNGADGVRVDGEHSLFNTITQNSITENEALGIENIGGGNTELPPPLIVDYTPTQASGTAELPGGAPCAGCTVEVFSDTGGEGAQYLGSGTTLADGSWTVGFAVPPDHEYLNATCTDTDGNTSEFSGSPVPFLIPAVEVDKEPVDPPGGVVGVDDDVAFRVTVRNVGTAVLTEVRLSDIYDSACLAFVTSDPYPDTVDLVAHELIWEDLTTRFGDLEPGDEMSFSVHFRAVAPCFAMNCVRVDAEDGAGNPVSDRWCADVTIEPGPPEIEVHKVVMDPVVCVGDPVIFVGVVNNTGGLPISSIAMTDTYDMGYLASLNDPAIWGPDDGELNHFLPDWPHVLPWWPPDSLMVWPLVFRAEAETASTVDTFKAMVNDVPATERGDTESVTILPEPGPCAGNLVTNGGFEDGLSGWIVAAGAPGTTRVESHSGASSALVGILPDGVDALGLDALGQRIRIPADAHHAQLRFWYKVDNSEDPDTRFNWFEAAVGVVGTGEEFTLVDRTADSGGWQQVTWNVPYHLIGEEIAFAFVAINDGSFACRKLWAFVDQVEVCVSRCGPDEVPPVFVPGMCWKAEDWPDYAPNGMPDFDQRGYYTETNGTIFTRTVDGPAASANSLWWFDSKFESGATPPPGVSDSYPLVEPYGAWDDHDPENVPPLVLDLVKRMQTDGFPDQPEAWIGTRPDDLANGIRDLLEERELLDDYSVTLERNPSYYLVRDEVQRCEDVLLLLGFWEHQPDGWRRLGGHWVNSAGVDCGLAPPASERRIGISDPFIDSAEAGYPGRHLPVLGHGYPHDWRLHDDAAYVSHDVYDAWIGRQDWGLVDYVRRDRVTGEFYPDVFRFWEANTPREFEEVQAEEYQDGAIRVVSEYMVAVSPLEDAVSLSLMPGFVDAPVSDVFAVDVMAESRTQPFDTVQVYLDFDPDQLQCVDASGNPISETVPISPTEVVQNEIDNEAGEVNYAAHVAFGEPALTGRVQVTRLYFRPVAATPAEGTQLTFNWTTPRRTDVLSGITSVLGRVRETTVRAGDPAVIQGRVVLQGRPAPPDALWEVPLTVELRDPATDATLQIFAPHTDDQGRFEIGGVTPGTYDLRVKGMHTLANRWSELTLAVGDNAVDLGELLEGDADNDNDVDASDASLVNLAFGTAPGDANWDPRADFNEDEVVDGVDMGLLGASFGRVGDVEVGPSAASLLLGSAAADLGLAGGIHAMSDAVRATAPVSITFSPASVTAEAGDIFTVDVVIQAGAQPVDTVEAHIVFPAGVLQVVDAGGDPATAVEGGTAFDMELTNGADNSAGTIDYAATMLGDSVSGNITVATLRFEALSPTLGEWLRFQVWPPVKTDVTYLGESVLTDWPAAGVTVEGYPRVYLPLILKGGS